MTLKEKFDSISCKDCDMPYCDIKCTILSEIELNKLEQIADKYAIEFGDWVGKNTLTYHDGKFRMKTLTPVFLTSEQLLERFKKEKGL